MTFPSRFQMQPLPSGNTRSAGWFPLLMLLPLWGQPADAHEAPGGWRYDTWCCHGGDCATVPDHAVEVLPEGLRITVQPGEHPQVTQLRVWFVPWPANPAVTKDYFTVKVNGRDVRVHLAQDDHWHICAYPRDELRCVYLKQTDG